MEINFTEQSLQQQLLDLGYKHHESDMYEILHSTRHLFQKKVTDDFGIRYFINAWYFPAMSTPKYDTHPSAPEGVEMEVQYTDMFDDNINVCPLFGDKIENSEKFFDEMWHRMSFGYYEEYE